MMLDEKLTVENEKYREIKAPACMEDRLRESLLDIKVKKKRRPLKIASFIIISGLIIAINSNSLAGLLRDRTIDEKIMSEYSEVSPEKLRAYKDEGIIQDVSRTVELDGKKILVEGIIVDSLGVNVFLDTEKDAYTSIRLIDGEKKGEYREFLSSGTGLESDQGEKWHYYFKGKLKNKRISLDFSNERNKSSSLEIDIDEEMKIDSFENIRVNRKLSLGNLNYNIKNIYITPISILVEGYNENIMELGLRTVFKQRKDYGAIALNLIINGERVETSESSRRTDMSGISFDYTYNDFPKDIESMDIELISLRDNGSREIVDRIKIK